MSSIADPVPVDAEALLRVWWCVSGMLVLLMQIGFICLEMGSVRPHNRSGIAVKNLVLLLVSTLAYGLLGFRLMYGESLVGVIGNPLNIENALSKGPEWMFLQLGFASVAATIISGALAGRSSLLSNAIIAFVVAAVVYPIFGHWVWNDGGWLRERGAVDFAGSGVVHMIGGVAALIVARVLGARRDLVNSDESFKPYLGPRALPHVTVGVIFLWIGWIGFNGGSVTMAHVENADLGFALIGNAVLTTSLAAGAGGLGALVLAAFHRRLVGPGRGMALEAYLSNNMGFDPYATLSGAMGGMVAVTANCEWLAGQLWLSVLVGAAGGVCCFLISLWVKRRVDDPVDAVAVHAGAGALGLMLATIQGWNATPPDQNGGFAIQLLTLVSGLVLVLAIILPLSKLLLRIGMLRVSDDDEEIGLSWEPPVKVIIPHQRANGTKPRLAAESERVSS